MLHSLLVSPPDKLLLKVPSNYDRPWRMCWKAVGSHGNAVRPHGNSIKVQHVVRTRDKPRSLYRWLERLFYTGAPGAKHDLHPARREVSSDGSILNHVLRSIFEVWPWRISFSSNKVPQLFRGLTPYLCAQFETTLFSFFFQVDYIKYLVPSIPS